MSITEVRSLGHFRKFVQSKKLAFIAFYSAFTDYAYIDHIRDLFLKKAGHFLYEKSTAYGVVNTAMYPQLAEEAKVYEVPALVAYVNKSEYKRLTGDASKWKIQIFLEEILREILG